MQNQSVFKIPSHRPEIILDTPAGPRRYTVHGQVLTFGREPVYLQAAQLPPELANDAYLDIESVDAVDAATPGTEVLHLKEERIEQPANDNTDPSEEARLKAERVGQPAAAAARANSKRR